MSKRIFQWLIAIFLVVAAARAADNPFVGKWRLNPSKSTLTDQMKVKSLGANKYGFDFGAGKTETVVADGTDQPVLFGTTLAVTVEGPSSWKVVRKKDGRVLLTAIWKLSGNGKTLTDHYKEYQPNGSTFSLDFMYERTEGNSGFPGTWESTSEKVNSVYEIQIKPYGDGGLSFMTPSQHENQNMKFDGKDYANEGPDVPAGFMSSGRRLNDHTLEMTDKIKGEIRATRQMNTSPDRKTLTITLHPVGHSKPNILVFDRE